jgi:thiol-disulfide isomerase/thioredoxin
MNSKTTTEAAQTRKVHAYMTPFWDRLCVSFILRGVGVFFLPLLAGGILLSGCNGNRGPSGETPVISGVPRNTTYPMPPLNGKSLVSMGWNLGNGKRGVFSDYKGQVLVLDFYATWCAPCRISIPHLVQLQDRYEKEGLHVIGLNVGGPDDLDKVPGFAEEFQIQYELAVPDDDLNELLLSDNSNIPQTFVFDRHGILKKRFVGYGAATGDEIDKAVESALKSSAD